MKLYSMKNQQIEGWSTGFCCRFLKGSKMKFHTDLVICPPNVVKVQYESG